MASRHSRVQGEVHDVGVRDGPGWADCQAAQEAEAQQGKLVNHDWDQRSESKQHTTSQLVTSGQCNGL